MQVSVQLTGDVHDVIAALQKIVGQEDTITIDDKVEEEKSHIDMSKLRAKEAEDDDEPKAPRKRRTKAEMEAARAAEAKTEVASAKAARASATKEAEDAADDFGFEDAPKQKTKELDLERDIRPAFIEHSKKYGKEKTAEILKRFFKPGERARVDAIPQNMYPQVIASLEAPVQ